EEEFALLQLLFGEGMELTCAARQLRITQKQAQRVAARIGSKFRQGLRLRTTMPVERPRRVSKEDTMARELVLNDEEIIVTLQHLRETPPLRFDHIGELRAMLAATWIPVSRLRHIAEQPEVFQALQARHIPLDWLTVPDATLDRVDVPE